MTEVIVLQASLDPSAVMTSLQQIEKRVDQMVEHSDKRIKIMGVNMQTTLSILRSELSTLQAKDILDDKEEKRFQELQVEIIKTAGTLEQLIALEQKKHGINFDTGKTERARKSFSDIEKIIIRINVDALTDKITKMATRGTAVIKQASDAIKKELNEAFEDPYKSADELLAIMRKLDEQADQIVSKGGGLADEPGKIIGITERRAGDPVEPAVSGEQDALKRRASGIASEQLGLDLERRAESLMKNTNDKIQDGGRIIKASLQNIFEVDPSTEEYQQEIRELESIMKRLENVKDADAVSTEELAQVGEMNDKLRQLVVTATKGSDEVDEASKKRIVALKQQAQLEAAVGEANATEAAQSTKNIMKKERQIKNVIKAYQDEQKLIQKVGQETKKLTPVAKALQDKKIENEHKAFIKETNQLLASEQKEVRKIGVELRSMGIKAEKAFDQSEDGGEEFLKVLRDLRSQAKDTGRTFGTEMSQGSDRATASLWKLGNAADRMGARSVGSIIRISDALGGLGPAAIVGAVAIAGIGFALTKIAELAFEVSKKFASMFANLTKDAVEASRAIEVMDRQLAGLLGDDQIGRGFRDLLLDKSFEVGLNLTGDFARVVVPLARDIDDVEKAAELAASLAHAFQDTDEAISNAIKQASGGHFRPLIQRFGFTPAEIDKIQEYQETMGQLGGAIEGIGDAVERRGLDIENFHGTLQFLGGQFDVLKEKVLITFGEPVKDAIASELEKLFDLVENNKDAILGFFDNLGKAVADVVEAIGNFMTDLVGDIDDADFVSWEEEIGELGDAIAEAVDNLRLLLGVEDTNLVEILTSLTEAATSLTEELAQIVEYIDGMKNIVTLGGLTSKEFFGFSIEGLFRDIATPSTYGIEKIIPFFKILTDVASDGEIEIADLRDSLFELGASQDAVGPIIEVLTAMGRESFTASEAAAILESVQDDLTDSTNMTAVAMREAADAALKYRTQLLDLAADEKLAIEAQEKIDDALEKMVTDRYINEEKIHTRAARDRNKADLKRSEAREDAELKNQQRLIKLNADYHAKLEQAVENFNRKEVDIFIKRADKLADADRVEADKRIDIERKFRDRLKDIRAKFDLDAEEAIRRNDAVALLRIRRRMALELDQAKDNRDRQLRDAGDAAQKKRDDIQIWLEREIRDNDLAEERKLQDLITADDLKRAEIAQQYGWELDKIQENYDRQKAVIDLNEQNAMDDLEVSMGHRRTALDKSLEAEYKIVEEWIDKEVEYLRLKAQEAQAIRSSMYQIYSQEGSLSRYLPSYQGLEGNLGLMPGVGGPGGPMTLGAMSPAQMQQFIGSLTGTSQPSPHNPYGYGGATLENLQSMLPQATTPTGVLNFGSPNANFRQLLDILGASGASVNYQVGGARHGGGPVTPGNRYNVNEKGIESFLATRAGMVIPHEPLLMSQPSTTSGVSIDNSRKIDAQINAMDPSYVSPIQRAVTREIIAEEYLKWGLIN